MPFYQCNAKSAKFAPMKAITTISTAIALSVLACVCGDNHKTYDAQPVAPLYKYMYEYARTDSAGRVAIEDSLQYWAPQTEAFMKVVSNAAYPEHLQLLAWSGSLPVEIFTPAVDSVFTTIEPVEIAMGHILGSAADNNLELPTRQYAAVVYGRPHSVLFVDSVMLIALNHYLGAEYEGYDHWPVYERLLKEPSMMPYDIAEALVGTQYPYNGGDNATVLSRLLYEGALTHAKMQLVPDAEQMRALGYVSQQYDYLTEHEKELWENLVGNQLLFDTSATTIARLVNPAPITSILDGHCPGRAGRFIGYQMVKSYLKNNPDATLPFLLSPDFYSVPDILSQVNYRP